MATYLERLTARLLTGLALLPTECTDRHRQFLVDQQNDDGGFSGRDGPSDLYYTAFALRGLAVLGGLEQAADAAAHYLAMRQGIVGIVPPGREKAIQPEGSIVDFYSWIYAARLLEVLTDHNLFASLNRHWADDVIARIGRLRRDDGGFAKGAAGHLSSTYHSFLALLCYELVDRPMEQPLALRQFFLSQRMPTGGFREIRVSRRAGANPTAAAIGGLSILDALDANIGEKTASFLAELQNDEGGFRANTRIPIADLLSSFTALWTLAEVGALADCDLNGAHRFALAMRTESGGFFAAAWDDTADVEYTFYGMGCLAVSVESDTAKGASHPSSDRSE